MSKTDDGVSGAWRLLSTAASVAVGGQGSSITKLVRLYKLANKKLIVHASDVAVLCQGALPPSIQDLTLSFREQHILVNVLVTKVAKHQWASAFLLRSCDVNRAEKQLVLEQSGKASIKPVGVVANLARVAPRLARFLFPQIGLILGIVLSQIVRRLMDQVVDAEVGGASAATGLHRAGGVWSMTSGIDKEANSGLDTRISIPGLGSRLVLGEVLLIKKVSLHDDEITVDFEIHPAVAAYVKAITSVGIEAVSGARSGPGVIRDADAQPVLAEGVDGDAGVGSAVATALPPVDAPPVAPAAPLSWKDRLSRAGSALQTAYKTTERWATEADDKFRQAQARVAELAESSLAEVDQELVFDLADSALTEWNSELLSLDVLSPADLAPELLAEFDISDLAEFFDA